MKTTLNLITNAICRNYEEFTFNYKMDFITKYNLYKLNSIKQCKKIIVHFSFKNFHFEKKQMVLHFFLLELLSNQKCILTTSKKNISNLKLKTGSTTGCKLTLRNKNLFFFLDTLLLGIPRSEIFKGFSLKTLENYVNSFSTKLKELFIFHTLELDVEGRVQKLDLTFNFNSKICSTKSFYFLYNKFPVKTPDESLL